MAAGEGVAPLTRGEWALLAVATLFTAVSRLFALARTPWDPDEIRFMQALDAFDVARHRPHPPGFPLYVLAGKAIRLFGIGDFHALQALSFLASAAIVPAMFFLCRELGFRFSTALSAAMILAFMPNVWFYGGAAFSDVPSMTLVILAITLLLRGRRDPRAYVAGAVVLAIAVGVRPQNLLIGIAPFLIATAREIRRSVARVVVAAAILVAVIGASYGAAAWVTGWDAYVGALRAHGEYIARTDSFRVPTRPPLWRVFDVFFLMPYRAPVINAIMALLAAIGGITALVKRRVPVLLALAAFAPFCVFAWLFLDRFSASRFSIGYAPLIAVAVAEGLRLLARRPLFEAAASAALVVLMIVWTWPALTAVRATVAPTVAAVDWIAGHVDPTVATIYADRAMLPFAERYLRQFRLRTTDAPLASLGGYSLHEETSEGPGSASFVRRRGRLWDLVRRRYFSASVRPVAQTIEFAAGWYPEEGAEENVWRWMAGRSVAALPAIDGPARLMIGFDVPLDRLAVAPNVMIRLNGVIVDRFRATTQYADRDIIVPAPSGAANELVIETDRVMRARGDPRILGLRVVAFRWSAATN